LFIDALDGFEGLDGQTYRNLVDKLKIRTTIAPNALKLCVSSREYPMFQDHLPPRKDYDSRISLNSICSAMFVTDLALLGAETLAWVPHFA
jgi:hypothetical protein